MPTQTRQQVADEINRLESQGATESQIMAHIAKSGYKDTDFNVDMDGKTRPMVVGFGYTGNSSKAELAAVQQIDAEVEKDSKYYESVVASSKAVPKTSTSETTTSIATVTGGGSLTRYSTPATDTPASTALDTAGTNQYKLGQAYAANPNSKTGQAVLNRSLSEGVITQEEYDKLKNATPEERAANKEKATEMFAKSENSFSDAAQAKAPGTSSVEIVPSENSSTISVKYQSTVGESSTTLSNSSTGKGTTEKIDGKTYDVEQSSDGATTSYTPTDSPAGLKAKVVVDNNENVISTPTALDSTQTNQSDFVGPPQQLTEQGIPAGTTTGVAFDDKGNLKPGWTYDEFGTPVNIGTAPAKEQQTGNDTSKIVNVQTEADGTVIQTFADGAILTINPDGTQTFSSGPEEQARQQREVTSASESQAAESGAHGLPYDDEGNLMPGWSLDENNDPVWVGGDFVEPATAALAQQGRAAAQSNVQGASRSLKDSNAAGANKVQAVEPDDWRVRLSLAPGAPYLYGAAKAGDILFPLQGTNGVLFPYTPQIQTSYRASYDPGELVHSNYKMHFYKGSSVDDVTITADFTAQDTAEANYLLAVMHFFKSATKMFYGQDHSPRAGTPPPLLYLTGYGAYQFDRHPLVLTNFTLNLPNDVDYIRAGSTKVWGGMNIAQEGKKAINSAATTPLDRLKTAFNGLIKKGGTKEEPKFANNNSLATGDSTYVPTKIQIQLSLTPIVSRKDISDRFSLEKYAKGQLTRGSRNNSGGIW